jgi:hypothetical protein
MMAACETGNTQKKTARFAGYGRFPGFSDARSAHAACRQTLPLRAGIISIIVVHIDRQCGWHKRTLSVHRVAL